MCSLLLLNPDLNSFVFSWTFVEGSVNNFKSIAYRTWYIHCMSTALQAGLAGTVILTTTNHKQDSPLPVVLTQIWIELKRNLLIQELWHRHRIVTDFWEWVGSSDSLNQSSCIEVNPILFINLKIYP